MTGNPIKTNDCPDSPTEPPPTLGQHTSEILTEILGYGPEKSTELKKDKIV